MRMPRQVHVELQLGNTTSMPLPTNADRSRMEAVLEMQTDSVQWKLVREFVSLSLLNHKNLTETRVCDI